MLHILAYILDRDLICQWRQWYYYAGSISQFKNNQFFGWHIEFPIDSGDLISYRPNAFNNWLITSIGHYLNNQPHGVMYHWYGLCYVSTVGQLKSIQRYRYGKLQSISCLFDQNYREDLNDKTKLMRSLYIRSGNKTYRIKKYPRQ